MKAIHYSGTRKSAVARATLAPGTGKITVNGVPLDAIEPRLARMRLREPILLAGDAVEKVDIHVTVQGGGFMGQSEAARLAIAKVLVGYQKKLQEAFLKYDRHLLVADVRRKETRKPNSHGKARAKRQKSYR
ncbi:30S ribosomal protein S9 [Candidatus Woesearchaeota archaeon]|nr:30S ribosomal protein S9 [Candidatus Woesearchaeota archaeon]